MPFCGTIGQIIETQRNDNKKLLFEWQINNFFSLSDKVGHWYNSPLFSFSDGCWVLGLFPNGQSQPGYVILFIEKKDTSPPKNILLTFAIKGSDGVEMRVETQWEFSNGNDPCFWSQICLRSKLTKLKSRFMPDDILIITCNLETDAPRDANEVSIIQDSRSFKIQEVQTDEEYREPSADNTSGYQSMDMQDASIQTDMEINDGVQSKQGAEEWQKSLLNLLESGKESDVVIKVKGKEFPAHRIILQARSTVFEAMFSHNMVEEQSGIVTLEDCNPETFMDFLKHVYTGSTNMISTRNVFSLYSVADKYDLGTLKEKCVDFMKKNITVASFCEIITLAVKYNEKELIKLATEFFCANTLSIVRTVEWQTFLAENPTVGNELFIFSYSQKK